MVTLGDAKRSAAALFTQGQHLAALRLYDAVVSSAPLDYEARIRVADAARALGDTRATNVYRATARYCLAAGHPLSALVCCRVLESQGGESAGIASETLAALQSMYGLHSARIGTVAARIALPAEATPIDIPDVSQPAPRDAVDSALHRAEHCCDALDGYPQSLHAIPLLSAMSEDAFSRTVAAMVLVRMPTGADVIRQGEPGRSLFFVASGNLAVIATDGLGQSTELARLGENAVFGEMSLLSAQPRSASVRCLSDVDLFEIDGGALAALSDELGPVAAALHGFTRERLLNNVMATSKLFRAFTRPQQRDLLRRFTSQDVTAGDAVIREGEASRGLYVVLSGELAAQRRLGDDEPVQLGSLKTGDVFGEMSLISETPTTATVVAVRPSTVLFLGREFVSRIVAGVPEIRNYLEELTQERSTENSLVLGEDEIPADERVLI